MNVSDEVLAIHGGKPAISAAAPAWPIADPQVLQALQAAYTDGSWGKYHGGHCQFLAELLRQMHSIDHVLLCCSGTIGIELALRGLKIQEHDEVIVAGYDFSGNFRSIEAVGARPVLVDIDPQTWCINEHRIEAAISDKTRAILVSHLHGGLAAMPEIGQIAQRHGLRIVEDACQAPGAMVDDRRAGTWGDVGVLSFGGSKLLTAGRGGAIITKHADVHQRAKIFGERGNDAFALSQLQAVVLVPQLTAMAKRNAIRLGNVRRLREQCRGLPGLRPIAEPTGAWAPVYYKVAWLYERAAYRDCSREQLIAALQAEGIDIDAGFRGFTRRSNRRCRKVGSLQHSERASNDTVLLHHPVLLESEETIDRVASAIWKVARALSR